MGTGEERFHAAQIHSVTALDAAHDTALDDAVLFLHVFELIEENARFTDHIRQFPGGDHNVDIAYAVVAEFFAGRLVFLREAGHHRDHHQILRFDADLLRVVAFGDRSEHLLRRLG